MCKQLHKRLSKDAVIEILMALHEHKILEEQACTLMEIHRSRLYVLKHLWLQEGDSFQLHTERVSNGRLLSLEIKEFLFEEFRFIRKEAKYSRGEFNFALLSEELDKQFNCFLHRNTIRRLAIKSGYCKPIPGKKTNVYRRFKMAGPGMLFQHDSYIHRWIPNRPNKQALLLTKDDYTRKMVCGVIVPVETR